MTSCDNIWLAIKFGAWALGIACAVFGLFMAGYERGRRIEAEARDS